MIISHTLRYVYIGIPRTASKSMNTWLVKNYAGESFGYHHQWQVPEEVKDYLIFTIVRNPYERVISGHFHVPWGEVEASQSVREQKAPPTKAAEPFAYQLSQAGLWGDGTVKVEGGDVPEVAMNQWSFVQKAGVSFILYFEKLPGGLQDLPFVEGANIPPFPHHLERGIRPPGNFFDFKDNEEEEVLWTYASADFETFGYKRFKCGLPEEAPNSLKLF